ncbi:MAG: hypothetical protein IKP71_11070, partial [Candidatus Riflebacteria bacterium]|nr:hypothetical protein [Candidatus Riflebacteria bacterium]
MSRLVFKSVNYNKTLLFTKDAAPRLSCKEMVGELSSISETEGADCRAIRGVAILKFIKFITLYLLVAVFSLLAPKAFALQQLTNPDFTNGTTGWTPTTRINGANGSNTAINTQNNNLRIIGDNNSGTNTIYDGMAHQSFTTPASPINVKINWGAWTVTYTDHGNMFQAKTYDQVNHFIAYGTGTGADSTGGATLSSTTSTNNNLNVAAGTSNITNLNISTTYYAKLYAKARIRRRAYTVQFSSLSVNFSPSGLAGEAISNGISLSWNPSTSNAVTLNKYYVYRSTTSGSGYTKIAEVNAGITNYTDTTAAEGNTYYYVISDLDTSSVESPYSKEINLFYLKAPTGLTAQYSYDTANQQDKVTLNWNAKAVAGLQSYSIYRSTSENGVYSLIGSTNSTTTTLTDTEVTPGTTYYYKVCCTITNATSGLSQAVSCYISKPPTNLAVNINGSNNAVLTWSAPSPINAGHNGYAVLRGNSSSGPFTQIGTVSGSTLTYTDTSTTISDGDCYFYVVTDIDSSSHYISGYSNIATASKLSAPTHLTATSNNGFITLNWNASTCPPAKLGGYNIYRSDSSTGPFTQIGTVVGNVLTYDDTTATEGVTWYYVVSTYNQSNVESEYSNKASSMIPTLSLTVSIDSSVAPEIVRPEGSLVGIPVNWEVSKIGSELPITGYTVTIYKSNGTEVQSGFTSDGSATSYTVNNVLLENGQSYYATVVVYYTIGSADKNREFFSSNSFIAITPKIINVVDGWSGKDIAYSFFDNRVEACWEHDEDSVVVRYEAAVGTTPYGSDVVNWQDIGLAKRIALTTPELASGTTYYTSVRGITQQKNQAVLGCSNGFIARKDPVTKDTDALNFFNNARVLESLSTDNGKLTPTGEIANGNWKYYKSFTITEPGVTDRVNAPCLVDFTIPAGQRPGNVREFRVVDDQGNVVHRYNLTTPNNSTVDHPYIVFLVNMKQGETRTYYIYWGDNTAAEQAHRFVNNTNQNSLKAWTPYYSRKDMPAGFDEANIGNKIDFGGDNYLDDGVVTQNLNELTRFYFFGTNAKSNWYLCVNGLLSKNESPYWQYNCTNRWREFIGDNSMPQEYIGYNTPSKWLPGACICPLWVDLMTGDAWTESGVYKTTANNPKRLIFTWITYRFGVTDDAYRIQVVMYETSDIAIRYNLINPRALIANGTYDRAVNLEHHTVGISNGNNTYYLYHTPLQVGINQNPTAFYQCMNAFDNTKVEGSIVGNGTEYKVAHFESMVFDTRIASPKWTSLQYDTTITGTRKIELAYRTGNTPLPDNSWTAWSAVTSVTSSVTNGEIPVTTSGRYIQYKADFIKSANAGTMSLNEVRFVYGGISIQNVSSVINGEPVTEVTQGQTNIPLTVTIKNESPTDLSLAVATLTFTLNGHSATLTDPSLPFNIAAGELTTLTYSVNIAENATTGECTIDALATVSALIYDDGAQTPLTWTVKSKSGLIIDNVYSEYTKVTKGYSYNLFVTLTNTGETDCMLNSILPTYASGTYTFTFDPSYGLATG